MALGKPAGTGAAGGEIGGTCDPGPSEPAKAMKPMALSWHRKAQAGRPENR